MAGFTIHPLALIFALSLVVILGANEIGRAVGTRFGSRGGDDVSTLEGAILGLLALMIGFTFAMAVTRYEARRVAVLDEANSIGTTALRARLLPAPQAAASLKLLREYVQIRLDVTRQAPTVADLTAAITRSNAIHEALWLQAEAVAAKDKAMVPTGLFIQSLNEMIDNQEKRVTAAMSRLPSIVLAALYCITALSCGFSGYSRGLKGRRSRLPPYLMGVLIAAVILLIQDLDLPAQGFIGVSQQPMINVAASLAGYPE